MRLVTFKRFFSMLHPKYETASARLAPNCNPVICLMYCNKMAIFMKKIYTATCA